MATGVAHGGAHRNGPQGCPPRWPTWCPLEWLMGVPTEVVHWSGPWERLPGWPMGVPTGVAHWGGPWECPLRWPTGVPTGVARGGAYQGGPWGVPTGVPTWTGRFLHVQVYSCTGLVYPLFSDLCVRCWRTAFWKKDGGGFFCGQGWPTENRYTGIPIFFGPPCPLTRHHM